MNLPTPPATYRPDDQAQLRRSLEQAVNSLQRDVQRAIAPGLVALGTTTSPTINANAGMVFSASAATTATVQVPSGGSSGQQVVLLLTNSGGGSWTPAFHASLVISSGYSAPSLSAAAMTVIRLTCQGTTWVVG